jgi:hypothetical protein
LGRALGRPSRRGQARTRRGQPQVRQNRSHPSCSLHVRHSTPPASTPQAREQLRAHLGAVARHRGARARVAAPPDLPCALRLRLPTGLQQHAPFRAHAEPAGPAQPGGEPGVLPAQPRTSSRVSPRRLRSGAASLPPGSAVSERRTGASSPPYPSSRGRAHPRSGAPASRRACPTHCRPTGSALLPGHRGTARPRWPPFCRAGARSLPCGVRPPARRASVKSRLANGEQAPRLPSAN